MAVAWKHDGGVKGTGGAEVLVFLLTCCLSLCHTAEVFLSENPRVMQERAIFILGKEDLMAKAQDFG